MQRAGHTRSSPSAGWKEGDIAFLKPNMSFSHNDYKDLIASGYMPEKATCHPVIILATKDNKAIITPISAYSTETNNFLPPWSQRWHQAKNPDDFRAFVGTQRPNTRHASLRLADSSMSMPKPQASWVYIRSFWCVPFSVLGNFNKSRTLLRVHADSVAQLRKDMRKFEQQHKDAGERLNASTVPSSTPSRVTSHRHNGIR